MAQVLLKYPPNLEESNSKPTGQGFGAARKGPQVHGKIEAVVDEDVFGKALSKDACFTSPYGRLSET